MAGKISDFNAADYLADDETVAEYLTAALEEGDTDILLSAIGDVARAKGMTYIAERTGLGRESLYKALKPAAKPRFETILKVLHSLDVKIIITPLKS